MKLFMKFIHEVGSYGLAGGFAVQLIVLAHGGVDPSSTREQVEIIGLWLVMPSLLVVLASGLWAMFLRPSFFSKGWIWMKIFLTVPPSYAAIATFPWVRSGAGERTGTVLWVALVASVIVTAFSVWRPKGVLVSGF
ncbi:MAG: hypothetical protein ACFB9M_00465 [Myxococcota bacterium]